MRKFILVDGKKLYIETSEKVFAMDGKNYQVQEEPTDPPSDPPNDPLADPPVGADEEEKEIEKEAQALSKSIVDKVSALLSGNKTSQAVKDKMAAIGAKKIDPNGEKLKLFTKKNGKSVEIDKELGGDMGKWFQALLRKDTAGLKDYYMKWEPLNETTAAEGGRLVPVALYNVLIDIMEDVAVIKPRANVIDMTSMKTNQLNLDSVLTKPVVQWGSEQAVKATSSMTFNQISLTPYKLAAIVPVTTELIQDSPFAVIQIVAKALADGVVKAEERAFAIGSGTGQPTGFSTGYTPVWTVDAAGAVSIDHIQGAYWHMPSYYRTRAYWLANQIAISILAELKDTTNRPILLESGIITEPGIPALKGRPVLEQNDLASNAIYFCDLSQYYIGMKLPMTIDVADQATVAGYNLWERNMVAVRVEERVDGELVTTRALTSITNINS